MYKSGALGVTEEIAFGPGRGGRTEAGPPPRRARAWLFRPGSRGADPPRSESVHRPAVWILHRVPRGSPPRLRPQNVVDAREHLNLARRSPISAIALQALALEPATQATLKSAALPLALTAAVTDGASAGVRARPPSTPPRPG